MSKSARFALALVSALCAAFIAMPTTAMADEPDVTRAQWIHKIVDTFDVTIEQPVYPEEYFTDISADDPYYEDFVLALEFGIIDEPLGGEVRPTGAATRDFAAHTLNYCLGYQLQEESYTFSDSAECTYPDDDQIAVNRGWFALSSGKFNPTQPVTSTEMTAAFEDAERVWNSIDIDENHRDVVQAASGIKVIPAGTAVTQTSAVTYQVTDCPTTIAAGDIFVAYFDGLPNSFTASHVTSLGNVTTITVSAVGVEDAFSNIDCEGVTHIDLSADEYSTVGTMSVQSLSTQAIQFPSFTVTPGSDGRSLTAKASAGVKGDTANGYVDASVSLSNLDLNYNVKSNSAVVYVSGNMDARIGIGGSWNVTVPIKTIPIAGVGSVKLELIQKLSGEAYAGMGATFKAGFQVDTSGDVRLIKEFNKKTPTIRAMVQLTQDLKLSANINLAVAKGSVWAKIGTFTKAEVVSYASGTPKTCASISQCLTASAGAEASINLIVWKKEWSKTLTIWDMSNSPVKMYFHYEDGKLIDKCTRNAASGSSGSTSSSSKTAYN